MGDWEQQLHGFPSSALSFLEKETGAAAPSPFQCVSMLSLGAVELYTLKKEILFGTAVAPLYLESPKGRRVRKEEISGRQGRFVSSPK